MQDSKAESAVDGSGEKLREMKRRIEVIKSSEEIGVKYMQEWEEKIIEKRKAREEGLAEGRAEGLAEGHAEGIAQGEQKLLWELVQKKLKKGKDIVVIAEELEENEEFIRQLIQKESENT